MKFRDKPRSPLGRRRALAVLLLPTLIVNLDATVLIVALPTIAHTLNADTRQLQWAMDAYTLVLAGALLICGNLGDVWGYRRTLTAGLVTFAGASIVGASAPSVEALIAARGAMGAGAALLMPSTLSTIAAVFPEPGGRGRAFAAWSGTAGLGLALGPVLAGVLLRYFAWGSVLWINVPIALIALAGTFLVVPQVRGGAHQRLDLIGAAASATSLGLLLAGIINTANVGWVSPLSGGLVVGGCFGLVLFVLWEGRCVHPLLPLTLFHDRRFLAALTALTLANAALSGMLFIITQRLQEVDGFTSLQTGLRAAPAALAVIVGSVVSPIVIRLWGRRTAMVTGLLVVAGGMAGLAATGSSTPYVQLLPGLAALGLGLGLVMPATTGTIMDALPPGQAGAGSATNATFVQAGNALGVAALGAIFSACYRNTLAGSRAFRTLSPHDQLTASRSIAGALRVRASHVPDLISAAKGAFISGMHAAAVVGVGLVLCAVLVVLLCHPATPRPSPSCLHDGSAGSSPVGDAPHTSLSE